jgi:hypothetical protein
MRQLTKSKGSIMRPKYATLALVVFLMSGCITPPPRSEAFFQEMAEIRSVLEANADRFVPAPPIVVKQAGKLLVTEFTLYNSTSYEICFDQIGTNISATGREDGFERHGREVSYSAASPRIAAGAATTIRVDTEMYPFLLNQTLFTSPSVSAFTGIFGRHREDPIAESALPNERISVFGRPIQVEHGLRIFACQAQDRTFGPSISVNTPISRPFFAMQP